MLLLRAVDALRTAHSVLCACVTVITLTCEDAYSSIWSTIEPACEPHEALVPKACAAASPWLQTDHLGTRLRHAVRTRHCTAAISQLPL